MNPARDRDLETLVEIRDRPVTFLLVMLLVLSVAGGIIMTFAFSDTSLEIRQRGLAALAVVLPLLCATVFVRRRESKIPYSLEVRSVIWKVMLSSYLVVALLVGVAAIVVPGIAAIRLLIGILALSPIAILARMLLKTEGRTRRYKQPR